jgi:hypothetical protein
MCDEVTLILPTGKIKFLSLTAWPTITLFVKKPFGKSMTFQIAKRNWLLQLFFYTGTLSNLQITLVIFIFSLSLSLFCY